MQQGFVRSGTVVVSLSDDPGLDGADEPISPAGGLLVDGGLTIPEALATDAIGVLAVRGNLFDDGTGVRLCEMLAESFPPQCGGARLEVAGFGFDQIGQLPDAESISVTSAQGVTWTDGYVSLLGELEGDVLMVSSNTV